MLEVAAPIAAAISSSARGSTRGTIFVGDTV
jgi:hypothetical protein